MGTERWPDQTTRPYQGTVSLRGRAASSPPHYAYLASQPPSKLLSTRLSKQQIVAKLDLTLSLPQSAPSRIPMLQLKTLVYRRVARPSGRGRGGGGTRVVQRCSGAGAMMRPLSMARCTTFFIFRSTGPACCCLMQLQLPLILGTARPL